MSMWPMIIMSRLASKECRRVLAVHDVEEACSTHACACVRVPSFEWVYRSNGKSCAQIHFTRHSLPDLCQMSCLLSASELRVRLHVASLTHSPGMPSWTASASSSSSSSSSSGVTIGVRSPPARLRVVVVVRLSGEVPPLPPPPSDPPSSSSARSVYRTLAIKSSPSRSEAFRIYAGTSTAR